MIYKDKYTISKHNKEIDKLSRIEEYLEEEFSRKGRRIRQSKFLAFNKIIINLIGEESWNKIPLDNKKSLFDEWCYLNNNKNKEKINNWILNEIKKISISLYRHVKINLILK